MVAYRNLRPTASTARQIAESHEDDQVKDLAKLVVELYDRVEQLERESTTRR